MENNTTWSQYSGKYYKLGADIGTSSNPVNRMAGSEGHEFCGTFDGNGKTIHIGLNSTGNYTAIFRCVNNAVSNSATIKNLNVEGTLRVCPNPATDFIDVYVKQAEGLAEIIDLNGKTVLSVQLNNEVNRIIISDLPQGVYVLRANGGARKFVKQ